MCEVGADRTEPIRFVLLLRSGFRLFCLCGVIVVRFRRFIATFGSWLCTPHFLYWFLALRFLFSYNQRFNPSSSGVYRLVHSPRGNKQIKKFPHFSFCKCAVCFLAPSQRHLYPHHMSFAEKLIGLCGTDGKVVGCGAHRNAHSFHFTLFCFALSFRARLLGLRVLPFANARNFAYRRLGIRPHFNKVKTTFLREAQRLPNFHCPKIFAGFVYDHYRRHPDLPVDSWPPLHWLGAALKA